MERLLTSNDTGAPLANAFTQYSRKDDNHHSEIFVEVANHPPPVISGLAISFPPTREIDRSYLGRSHGSQVGCSSVRSRICGAISWNHGAIYFLSSPALNRRSRSTIESLHPHQENEKISLKTTLGFDFNRSKRHDKGLTYGEKTPGTVTLGRK